MSNDAKIKAICPAGGVDGIPAAILEQQGGETQGVKVVGTFVAPDTDALYERNQLCKTCSPAGSRYSTRSTNCVTPTKTRTSRKPGLWSSHRCSDRDLAVLTAF